MQRETKPIIFKKTLKDGSVKEYQIKNVHEAVSQVFDLDTYLVPFLQEEPFYCEISRYIKKVPTLSVPTAALSYNMRSDQFQLLWNPLFFATLTEFQVKNVLLHEYNHFVFRHLTERRREPALAHNIATDAAINSLIVKHAPDSRSSRGGELPLPGFCIVPGKRPDPPPPDVLAKMSEEQIKFNEKMASLIESWKDLQCTEWYFESLMSFLQENPPPERQECPVHGPAARKRRQQQQGQQDGGEKRGKQPGEPQPDGEHCDEHEHGEGDSCDCPDCSGDEGECTCGQGSNGWIDSFDDHSAWDDLPDEMYEYVRSRAQAIAEKAVREAEQRSNGWGCVPAHMREAIRRSVSNIVNWREVLRNFIGHTTRGSRRKSIKRINKKYPYIHSGTAKSYIAKGLIAVDESGSVPNGCVELFFAELASLTKIVDIDIVSFDAGCDPQEIVTWRKGQKLPAYRTRCGGTDFNAPTEVANDPAFRGRWDFLIILTDGLAPKPIASRVPRAWGIAPKCKMEFETSDLVFYIEPGSPVTKGSWY